MPITAEAAFFPTRFGNTGDDLIGLGCLALLEAHGLDVWVCDEALHDAAFAGDTEYLRAVLGGFGGFVFFAGGGNLGIYPDNERLRTAVIAASPAARGFLVFPQSGVSVERALLDDRVTTWARDATTHAMLAAAGARTALVPDAALLTASRFERVPDGDGTAWILRAPGRDVERVDHTVTVDGPAADLTFDLPLDGVVDSLRPARWVVSDRLHGGLIALLMGKRTAFLPVSYHKTRSFFDTWLRGDAGVAFVTSDEELAAFRTRAVPPSLDIVELAWATANTELWRFRDTSARAGTRASAPTRRVPSQAGASRTPGVAVRLPRIVADGPRRARLEATIDLPDGPVDVWFSAPEEALRGLASIEPFVIAALLPAMRTGSRLTVDGPVSPVLLRNLVGLQEVFNGWFPEFTVIPIEADPADRAPDVGSSVGSFFSGGVDSFFTAVSRRNELDLLIYVNGLDMVDPEVSYRSLVADRMAQASRELGLPLLEVRTNVRDFSAPYARWAEHFHTMALATVGHALSGLVREVMIAADRTYATAVPWGNHPVTTPLFSSDRVRFTPTGWGVSRVDRVAALADSPAAMRHLRVCWESPNSEYNCGRCEKCMRTKIALRIADALEACATVDDHLDPADYEVFGLTPGNLAYAERTLERAAERGHSDIAEVIRRMLDRHRRDTLTTTASDAVTELLATGDDAANFVAAHRDALYAALSAHHGRWLTKRALRDLPAKALKKLRRLVRRLLRPARNS